MNDTAEYKAIADYYGDRKAERSGVPLMNHINEGLILLDEMVATRAAKAAWCLHPIFQSDKDLERNWRQSLDFSGNIMMLVMEYRKTANYCLSEAVKLVDHTWGGPLELQFDRKPVLSPLLPVNQMLVADKVQNYKDFLIHHKGKHPRSRELEAYFLKWFEVLGITGHAFEFELKPLIS